MNPARRAIEAVAAAFDIPVSAILGPSRKRPVSFARFSIYVILRERGWTTTQVSAALGLDHSSVIHGTRRVADMDDAWHARHAKARGLLGSRSIVAWRIVYAKPIGPPEKPEEWKEPEAPKPTPKPLTHDDVWASRMAGARFGSVRVGAAAEYREGMPDYARVIT